MTEKNTPNFIERFTVRMPDGMRDAIAERAKANGRSMNSEIINLIEGGLDGVSDVSNEEIFSQQRELIEKQNELVRYLMSEMTAILKGIMPESPLTEKYESALKELDKSKGCFSKK